MSSINGISLYISSSQENKIKNKIHDFKNETNMENINNYHPGAHFIIIYNSSSVFIF